MIPLSHILVLSQPTFVRQQVENAYSDKPRRFWRGGQRDHHFKRASARTQPSLLPQ
jgi:hypothetical protein